MVACIQWQQERGWEAVRFWMYLRKTVTVECETRRRMKENTRIWGLKSWKNEVLTEMENTIEGAGLGKGGNQDFLCWT